MVLYFGASEIGSKIENGVGRVLGSCPVRWCVGSLEAVEDGDRSRLEHLGFEVVQKRHVGVCLGALEDVHRIDNEVSTVR